MMQEIKPIEWIDGQNNIITRSLLESKVVYQIITLEESNDGHITNAKTQMSILDVFLKALSNSKKKLTPELKQVIDDMEPDELVELFGPTTFNKTNTLGYAVRELNLEAVKYLLVKGHDLEICDYDTEKTLSTIFKGKPTKRRLEILEAFLKSFNGTIKLKQNIEKKYPHVEYLILLINYNAITKGNLSVEYKRFSPALKKRLIIDCPTVMQIAMEQKDEKFLPKDVSDIFIF